MNLDSGLALFAPRTVAREGHTRYYYYYIVYAGLSREQHKIKTYGQGLMQVTAKTSQKWATELDKKLADKQEVKR